MACELNGPDPSEPLYDLRELERAGVITFSPEFESLLALQEAGFIELALSDDGQLCFRLPGAAEFDGFPPGEVEEQARESLAVAWREALENEPLPAEVEEKALEVLISGGGRGVPGQFISYDVDPREALAVALEAR